MRFDSRQRRLLIVCIAAAFLIPLLSGNDEKGGYAEEVGRFLLVGGIVVALVPWMERRRARPSDPGTGKDDAPPVRAGNTPGAPARGAAARKAGTQQAVTLAASPADAFTRALEAVRALKRAAVTHADADAGEISARVGPSLRSVGEVVEVKLDDTGDGRVRVDVYSKARVTITSSDRDKAEDNVLAIVRALQRHL